MSTTLQVNHLGDQTFPSSGAAQWTTAPSSDLTTADNGGSSVTNPSALAAARIMVRDATRGTIIRARMKYTGTVTTDAVIVLFGRYSSTDYWQPLRNKSGAIEVTMTAASGTDVVDTLDKYTTPELDDHSWDCDGFDEITYAVKTATDGSTASLEMRII